MTEEEWLGGNDPAPMLDNLRAIKTDRKKRLFFGEWCRQSCESEDFEYLKTIEISDNYADGMLAHGILQATRLAYYKNSLNHSQSQWFQNHISYAIYAILGNQDTTLRSARWHLTQIHIAKSNPPQSGRCLPQICYLLRDIFGNPFRPVSVEPAWLTETVVSLAAVIYQDRVFDRMPILADALEEAGCANEEMLNHCRQPEEHVRGCWVVDLVLGKS